MQKERAILLGLISSETEEIQEEASLIELERLAETAGAEVVEVYKQRRNSPHPRTFFGKGKVEEIKEGCAQLGATLLICDQELTPAQLRNLEENVGVRVIDRTQLILDIFAQRARTKEGKLQVELAQMNYLLPRLTGRGVEMSRLGGGIGTRGPGETKLEVDKRRIRKRIADLSKELSEVRKHRRLHRKNRRSVPLPLVSLIGYTNAGKSTLLNTLTDSNVLAEDKLFATLDPTTRRVLLPTNETILLTDTVGFIQKLPHHLIAAFSATLEEVKEADLLLHVVDASHPNLEQQIQSVEDVLKSLEAEDKPSILVLNKSDNLADEPVLSADIKARYFGKPVAISAKYNRGLEKLLESISAALSARRVRTTFFIPFTDSAIISLVHQHGKVINQRYEEKGVSMEVELERILAERIMTRLKN
ncbi:GTPase HflX [Desulfofalx alkaliphila]|uniref:GTPase HflX n=1 Tax=Desulfofalx alkaliphila TaxID=105483 RepID=UPI0004E10F2B|nr:GTPase HflX [Desulfofalx alkaliphila]